MKNNSWNPTHYLKFAKERNQPFYDLLKLIAIQPDMTVVDLGCGTGHLTKVLHQTLQAKETLGIDSSDAMLKEANSLDIPGLHFKNQDILEFCPSNTYDLIFSNAALQWVKDHEGLFARYKSKLKPNGQLAIHVPDNFEYPSHTIAKELASEAPFKEELREGRDPSVLTIEAYSQLLNQLGFKEQHVRAQIYPHLLESTDSLVEWVKGSLLTYYQGYLSPERYNEFLQHYRERVMNFFGDLRPMFLPFKRILIWARV